MDEEDRHGMLDYARHYGLAMSNETPEPLSIDVEPYSQEGLDVFEAGPRWSFISDLTTFTGEKEKIQLPKDAARLLQQVFLIMKSNDLPDDLERHADLGNLRLETPLLRSDHELDVTKFLKSIGKELPPLGQLATQPIPVDEEADEGLSWPQMWRDLPSEYGRQLEHEKLEISQQALSLLASAIRPTFTQRDADDATFQDLIYRRDAPIKLFGSGFLREITPPVIYSPPQRPAVPSSPLTVPDDIMECDNFSEELQALRDSIEHGDRPSVDEGDIDYLNLNSSPTKTTDAAGLSYMEETPSTSSEKQLKTWQLRFEPPLSSSPQSIPTKKVSFSEILEEVRPLAFEAEVSKFEDDEAELEDIFKEVIEPSALKVRCEVEHEQLHAVDCMSRVPVPSLDMSVPDPPWKTRENRGVRDEELKGNYSVPLLSKFCIVYMSGITS